MIVDSGGDGSRREGPHFPFHTAIIAEARASIVVFLTAAATSQRSHHLQIAASRVTRPRESRLWTGQDRVHQS